MATRHRRGQMSAIGGSVFFFWLLAKPSQVHPNLGQAAIDQAVPRVGRGRGLVMGDGFFEARLGGSKLFGAFGHFSDYAIASGDGDAMREVNSGDRRPGQVQPIEQLQGLLSLGHGFRFLIERDQQVAEVSAQASKSSGESHATWVFFEQRLDHVDGTFLIIKGSCGLTVFAKQLGQISVTGGQNHAVISPLRCQLDEFTQDFDRLALGARRIASFPVRLQNRPSLAITLSE